MKSILLLISIIVYSFASSNMDKPFMTKQMLDNDLETHEYQVFYTKTLDIPLDNLTPKLVFSGTLSDYHDFFKKDMITKLSISNETLQSATSNALNSVKQTVNHTLNKSDILKNAGQNFGIALIMQPIAIGLFGDDHYVQVVDYYNQEVPKTRVIKYIVSDESLPKEELEMIYNSTEDRSYHFNRGKAASTFTVKQYREFRKTHNGVQK